MNLEAWKFSLFFFFALASIAFLANCGGVDSVYYDGRPCVQGVSLNSTGAEIYQAACSSCHGAIQNWGKPNDSASEIQIAINSTQPSMRHLSCLTTDQISSIAAALP